MQINFYKVFGLLLINSELFHVVNECLDLGTIKIPVKENGKDLTISVGFGRYGQTQEQKRIIKRAFLPKYNISEIPPLFSLNIKLNYPIKDNLNAILSSKIIPNEELNTLETNLLAILPFIKQATDKFYLAYCKFKLNQKISSGAYWEDIAYEQKIIQPPSLKDLSTYLFYEVKNQKGEKFKWVLSEGEILYSKFLSINERKKIRKIMKNGIEFTELLFIESLIYFYQEKYKEAYLNLAISLELILTKWLRTKMIGKNFTTITQVDKFIENTSKRELITVNVGLMSKIDRQLLEDGRQIFEIRNKIAHGKKETLSKGEVKKAFTVVTKLAKFLK